MGCVGRSFLWQEEPVSPRGHHGGTSSPQDDVLEMLEGLSPNLVPPCPRCRRFCGRSCCWWCGSPEAVPQEVIVPEGKWRKVSPASLSLSLPDADYQCIHRTSVSSLSAKESSFTSEEPLVSGEGCV